MQLFTNKYHHFLGFVEFLNLKMLPMPKMLSLYTGYAQLGHYSEHLDGVLAPIIKRFRDGDEPIQFDDVGEVSIIRQCVLHAHLKIRSCKTANNLENSYWQNGERIFTESHSKLSQTLGLGFAKILEKTLGVPIRKGRTIDEAYPENHYENNLRKDIVYWRDQEIADFRNNNPFPHAEEFKYQTTMPGGKTKKIVIKKKGRKNKTVIKKIVKRGKPQRKKNIATRPKRIANTSLVEGKRLGPNIFFREIPVKNGMLVIGRDRLGVVTQYPASDPLQNNYEGAELFTFIVNPENLGGQAHAERLRRYSSMYDIYDFKSLVAHFDTCLGNDIQGEIGGAYIMDPADSYPQTPSGLDGLFATERMRSKSVHMNNLYSMPKPAPGRYYVDGRSDTYSDRRFTQQARFTLRTCIPTATSTAVKLGTMYVTYAVLFTKPVLRVPFVGTASTYDSRITYPNGLPGGLQDINNAWATTITDKNLVRGNMGITPYTTEVNTTRYFPPGSYLINADVNITCSLQTPPNIQHVFYEWTTDGITYTPIGSHNVDGTAVSGVFTLYWGDSAAQDTFNFSVGTKVNFANDGLFYGLRLRYDVLKTTAYINSMSVQVAAVFPDTEEQKQLVAKTPFTKRILELEHKLNKLIIDTSDEVETESKEEKKTITRANTPLSARSRSHQNEQYFSVNNSTKERAVNVASLEPRRENRHTRMQIPREISQNKELMEVLQASGNTIEIEEDEDLPSKRGSLGSTSSWQKT